MREIHDRCYEDDCPCFRAGQRDTRLDFAQHAISVSAALEELRELLDLAEDMDQ